jgi:hypothetical protein
MKFVCLCRSLTKKNKTKSNKIMKGGLHIQDKLIQKQNKNQNRGELLLKEEAENKKMFKTKYTRL